jgi:chromosome segregation ATPase
MTSNNSNDRLDRIEALLEQIGQRVDSNAKSIQALSDERKENERQLQRDRAHLYQEMANLSSSMANLSSSMANLSSSMANLNNAQADFYRRLEQMDERQETLSRRQGDIVEILKLLQQREEE